MKIHLLFAGLLAGVLVMGAAAQTDGIDENALFGGDSAVAAPAGAPLPGADAASDDSLFDSASAVSSAEVGSTYQESFIKTEPIRIGGSFNFSMATGIDWFRDYADWNGDYFWSDPLTKKQDDPEDAAKAAADRRQVEVANPEKREDSSLNLSGNLWFSARPSADLRFFGKASFGFPFAIDAVSLQSYQSLIANMAAGSTWAQVESQADSAGVSLPNIKIWELYSDLDINDAVFLRVGKQMVKWGVGYFFQPADVISLSAVDVNNPKADREGPLAIKANIPIDIHNLDFYLIAPGSSNLTSILDLKPAVRFQAVLGNWELGLGATVDGGLNKATVLSDGTIQYDRDAQVKFIATASGAIWDFNVFAEGLVQRYQSGIYLNDNAYSYINSNTSPIYNTTPVGINLSSMTPIFETGTNNFAHTVVVNRDQWLFSATAGLSYSNADAYFNALVQYYYNGAGYDNLANVALDVARYLVASNDPSYTGAKLSAGSLAALAMGYTGKHYLGVNLGESFVKDSKVSVSTFLMWNISDLSGFVSPSVSIKLTDQINLGLNSSIYFGADNTQFRGIKQALTESGLGGLGDAFQMPRFKLGLTLNMGSGSF